MEEVVILVVEDEESLANFVSQELQFEGYQVLLASDGEQALTIFAEKQKTITLILLDWMLPKYDGLTVARRIRRQSQVPMILMTARDQMVDKVAGLDAGADDYLTKPFDIEELLARIRVILRRLTHANQLSEQALYYEYGDLQLDRTKHLVKKNGTLIPLTQKEFDLLAELMKHPEEVLTRDVLLNTVWGYDYFGQTNVVDVYIRSLRNKLDADSENRVIQTVRGVGYVLRGKNENI